MSFQLGTEKVLNKILKGQTQRQKLWWCFDRLINDSCSMESNYGHLKQDRIRYLWYLKLTCDFWFPVQHIKILQVITPVLRTRKRAEQTKSQQLFLGLSENWGHRANEHLPELERQPGTYKESQFTGSRSCGQKEQLVDQSLSRTSLRDKNAWRPSLNFTSRSITRFSG